MNYRHAFHAGNFADVMKHGVLLEALAALTADPAPLAVLDTHAGAGLYDLQDAFAARSGEATQGIARLMADPAAPPALARLREATAVANPDGALRWYPGSPRLALGALRPGDAWTGCELRADDAAALRFALRPQAGVQARVMEGDGYAAAATRSSAERRLVLIDPPFERADEADRIVETLAALRRDPGAAVIVWLPLKDLDGYDRLLSRVEALRLAPSVAVQARLAALDNPMRMNGAALLLIGLPQIEAAAFAAAEWAAKGSARPGARAVLDRFGG